VGSAGVSNFNLEQLVELVEFANIPPAVVQRRNDVFEQDVAVRHFCRQLGIQYVAYSSLGTQHTFSGEENPVLHSGALQAIAKERNASVAQVSSSCNLLYSPPLFT
jgi:diketogulonate reductase-like aldo/keto reductase